MISDEVKLRKPLIDDRIKLADGRVIIVFAKHLERGKLEHVVIEHVGGDQDGQREVIRSVEWIHMIKGCAILKRGKE